MFFVRTSAVHSQRPSAILQTTLNAGTLNRICHIRNIMAETVNEQTLRELINAGAVTAARLVGRDGGYTIQVEYGATRRSLATARGELRVLTLDSAGKLLQGMGIPCFMVDMTAYRAGRLRKARPDRAAALRNTRTLMRQAELIA